MNVRFFAPQHPSQAGLFQSKQRDLLPRRPGAKRAALLAVALLAIALHPVVAGAQTPVAGAPLSSAVTWLLEQQGDDGGFPGFSGESDPSTTADAIIALAAARAAGVPIDLQPALDYLADHALVLAQTGPGSAAKLSLALFAAGENPRNFATVNPFAIVEMAAEDGLIGFGPYEHALGILAIAAVSVEVPEAALDVALDTQTDDGGWAFDGSTEPGGADTNTTALMIQALVAAGMADHEAVGDARSWLLDARSEDGGFPYQPGGEIDANSTAASIQALLVAPGDHDTALARAGETLIAFQNDNGSFSWMLEPRDDNLFSTIQAIPAVAGMALPIVPVAAGYVIAALPGTRISA